MLVMVESKEKLESHLAQITSLLGFMVNREKSQLVPAQETQQLVGRPGISKC